MAALSVHCISLECSDSGFSGNQLYVSQLRESDVWLQSCLLVVLSLWKLL